MKRSIRNYRGFENVPIDKPDLIIQRSNFTKENDELMSVVFAPDPVTGLPCTDIGFMMKHKDKPEIAQYIQQRLQVAHESGVGSDNPDDALLAIRKYKEDIISYAQRIRDNFGSKVETKPE